MRITGTPLELDALIADSIDARSGALVVFGGTVRNHHQGRAVTRLSYSAYAPLAERMIQDIERETVARFEVHHCRVVHRTGDLDIGEVAIYAIVRAAHRREAFAAAQYAVDRVKHEVPVWKEEFYADGSSAFVDGCCIEKGSDHFSDYHEGHEENHLTL
jgi:molybdopterin synthase catalytic subunit